MSKCDTMGRDMMKHAIKEAAHERIVPLYAPSITSKSKTKNIPAVIPVETRMSGSSV